MSFTFLLSRLTAQAALEGFSTQLAHLLTRAGGSELICVYDMRRVFSGSCLAFFREVPSVCITIVAGLQLVNYMDKCRSISINV